MKCTIPEISWHNREPVLSVDICSLNGDFYRLASGGGDCHVLIWHLTIAPNGAVNQELVSDLTRHQKAVNCVRWSPSGKYLASGDDDANIIIWQLKTDNIPLLEGEPETKEIWNVFKIMRGHKEDVYDLCWSTDECKILSGSVDNTAILWDVAKGKMDHILIDHKGFVQGVAWDPKNQIVATISTDRTCRIFDRSGKQVKARIHKGRITSVPEGHILKDKEAKYFHDDTFKSFFRRLQFTPDGSLLIVPSGHMEVENCKLPINATLVFTLDNFSSPAIILPIPRQSSTVVRCCPILYELHEPGPNPIIKLPYRMIFAVGTDHDIILYDTQQTLPFARFQAIHYTRLTDLTWSPDGLLLVASSTDGFCSLITFEMDELGVPWVKMDLVELEDNAPLDISGCEELLDENVDTNNKKEEAKKRPSFLEQWALKTPKKRKMEIEQQAKDKVEPKKEELEVNRLIPRRITLVKVDEKKEAEAPKEAPVNVLVPRQKNPVVTETDATKTLTTETVPTETVATETKSVPRRITPVRIGSASKSEPKPPPVIEILDSPEKTVPLVSRKRKFDKISKKAVKPLVEKQLTEEPKVNVLVPRRITPVKVEDKKVLNLVSSGGEDVVELADLPVKVPVEVKKAPRRIVPVKVEDGSSVKRDSPAKQNADPKSKDTPKTQLPKINVGSLTKRKSSTETTPKKSLEDPLPIVDQSGTPKMQTPKTKEASLTKRKNSTPKKPANALLNFLQKSSEKRGKKKKLEDKQSGIDIVTLEVEARDAWTTDSQKEDNTVKKSENTTITVIQDEETEDFCLQLEDSQEGDDNNKKT